MKSLLTVCFLFLVSLAIAGGNQLMLGDKAKHTEVKMADTSGKEYSLTDLKKENGIVVIFSCNTCPFVLAWEDRYNDIYEWAKKNDVGIAVLDSNYMKRSGDDSLEAMKEHALEKHYNFPYLVDSESLIANAYGGQTTPHVFLFDKDFNLVYKGAIDDNYKNASDVKEEYLKDAITSLAAGEKIAVAETKPLGCSIKRKLD
ncbi:thioredoxin family protein [Mangrovibacterium lignilyticum]|uniref:thioredoxin family protein n=1 Tax=Mangrovibacterium lignilyticum TaxID=2668052 RepID=UPI0013D5189D|nr:thioredoxin family protein [Mangrovibacterium lignilyticum]